MRPDAETAKTGDCEACPRTSVALYLVTGMWICSTCAFKQREAISKQHAESIAVIDKAHQIDNSVALKSDIYNAQTIAFHELEAAINHNEEIPADQKGYALVAEADIRIKKYKEIIQARKAELVQLENECHAWTSNAQKKVATLEFKYKAQFKHIDVAYQPAGISKKEKSTTPTSKGKGYDKAAVLEASKKHGVPASLIQMMVTSRPGLTPDEAGKEQAPKFNKK